MYRPKARQRTREKKCGTSGRNRWYKYLYLLACLCCVLGSWTSAKYISEIEGVTSGGRPMDFEWSIEGTPDEEHEVTYVDFVNHSNPKPQTNVHKVLAQFQDLDDDTKQVGNRIKITAKDDVVTLTFKVKYIAEVRSTLQIRVYYGEDSQKNNPGGNVEIIHYTKEEKNTLPAGTIMPTTDLKIGGVPIAEAQGFTTDYVKGDDPKEILDKKSHIFLAAINPTEGKEAEWTCTLPIKFGSGVLTSEDEKTKAENRLYRFLSIETSATQAVK